MFEIELVFENNVIKIQYEKPVLLSNVLKEHAYVDSMPCGGNGKCGKCKVKSVGILSEITDEEKKLLSNEEISCGFRLSCRTYALGNTSIYYSTQIGTIQGLKSGYMPKIEMEPLFGKDKYFAAAVDIGTTTIAVYIYKFPEGKFVKSVSMPNEQAKFGSDVISRIEFSNNGGLSKLYETINIQIKAIDLNLKYFVITGNTTMLHLFCKLDPKSIAVLPFEPKSLFGFFSKNYYFPNCISAFVGADIVCSILASRITEKKNALLIDIGTNGEIALVRNGELICASTAAGPAFEGAGISCGVMAKSGAINKVYSKSNEIQFETIDNVSPIGLCGTGLVDCVATLLNLGLIDESGYLEEDIEIGNSKIFLKNKDIRMLQLAKGAIRAGMDTLLFENKMKYDEIEEFYVAGGFGSFLNIESCIKIGLIPVELKNKYVSLGNASGSGAAMILLSKSEFEKSKKIAESAKTIELSESQYFMDRYIDCMMFEEN